MPVEHISFVKYYTLGVKAICSNTLGKYIYIGKEIYVYFSPVPASNVQLVDIGLLEHSQKTYSKLKKNQHIIKLYLELFVVLVVRLMVVLLVILVRLLFVVVVVAAA